jgi:hypothetical protein
VTKASPFTTAGELVSPLCKVKGALPQLKSFPFSATKNETLLPALTFATALRFGIGAKPGFWADGRPSAPFLASPLEKTWPSVVRARACHKPQEMAATFVSSGTSYHPLQVSGTEPARWFEFLPLVNT